MLTRRDTLRILGASGLAAPALTACGGGDGPPAAATDPAGVRLVSADVAVSQGDSRAVPGVVSAMGAFTGDLWGRLAPTGNLALSPYSIAVALAMTANGAAGATRSQMLDVLHIRSLATHNAGLAALTRSLESLAGPVTLADGKSGEIDLASADQLFGDAETQFGRAFLTVLAKEYDAGMRTVDFRPRPRGLAHGHQRLDRPADPRPDPRHPAAGVGGPDDEAGAGQRPLLQGPLAEPVREGRDHAAGLPPRRRLAGRRTDDARGVPTGRGTWPARTGAGLACPTPATAWR